MAREPMLAPSMPAVDDAEPSDFSPWGAATNEPAVGHDAGGRGEASDRHRCGEAKLGARPGKIGKAARHGGVMKNGKLVLPRPKSSGGLPRSRSQQQLLREQQNRHQAEQQRQERRAQQLLRRKESLLGRQQSGAEQRPKSSGSRTQRSNLALSRSGSGTLARSQSYNLLEREAAHRVRLEQQHEQLVVERLRVQAPSPTELQRQNDKLKEEVVSLKKALLEGMRGHNRFVSGGQFRTSVTMFQAEQQQQQQQLHLQQLQVQQQARTNEGRRSARPVRQTRVGDLVGAPRRDPGEGAAGDGARQSASAVAAGSSGPHSHRTSEGNSEQLELEMGAARQQIGVLLETNSALKVQAERSDELLAELKRMRERLEEQDEALRASEQVARRSKEQVMQTHRLVLRKDQLIKSMSSELNSLRETRNESARGQQVTEVTWKQKTLAAQERAREAKAEARQLRKELDASKAELAEARSSSADVQETLDNLQRQVELKHAYANERNVARDQMAQLRTREEALVDKVLEAEKEARRLTRELQDERDESSELRRRAAAQNDRLADGEHVSYLTGMRLEAANRELAKLKETDLKNKQLIQALRTELEDTRITLKNVTDECDTFRLLQAQDDEEHNLARRLQMQLNKIEQAVAQAAAACGVAQLTQPDRPDETDKPEGAHEGAAQAEPLQRLQRQDTAECVAAANKLAEGASGCLQVLSTRLCAAEARVRELEGAVETAEAAAASARERADAVTKASLERALQSMVRLCVIAPSIKVKFGNENQDTVFQTPLPREEIRKMVQERVLPRFAKVFVQKQKGLAPDAKTSLDKWLPGMVRDLQGSIEKNLRQSFAHADPNKRLAS